MVQAGEMNSGPLSTGNQPGPAVGSAIEQICDQVNPGACFPIAHGDPVKHDRPARVAVAVVHFERGEQEIGVLRNGGEVLEILDADHAAAAQKPIGPQGAFGGEQRCREPIKIWDPDTVSEPISPGWSKCTTTMSRTGGVPVQEIASSTEGPESLRLIDPPFERPSFAQATYLVPASRLTKDVNQVDAICCSGGGFGPPVPYRSD